MADLAGYRADLSLIKAVDGTIHPMSGGGLSDKTEMIGGAGEKDIKLFNKTFSLPNPDTLSETELNANKAIIEIMNLLQFDSFSFEEKKKILKALYDSNCTNETDLALSCGCDPVRKVIADLATLLLQKTSEKTALPTPVKKVSGEKRLVEISIKIPLDMIRVVAGGAPVIADISGAPAAPAAAPAAPAAAAPAAAAAAPAAALSGLGTNMAAAFRSSSAKEVPANPLLTSSQVEQQPGQTTGITHPFIKSIAPASAAPASAAPAPAPAAAAPAPAVPLTPGGKEGNAIGIPMSVGVHNQKTRKLRLGN
jgi:hypothetical protein